MTSLSGAASADSASPISDVDRFQILLGIFALSKNLDEIRETLTQLQSRDNLEYLVRHQHPRIDSLLSKNYTDTHRLAILMAALTIYRLLIEKVRPNVGKDEPHRKSIETQLGECHSDDKSGGKIIWDVHQKI